MGRNTLAWFHRLAPQGRPTTRTIVQALVPVLRVFASSRRASSVTAVSVTSNLIKLGQRAERLVWARDVVPGSESVEWALGC